MTKPRSVETKKGVPQKLPIPTSADLSPLLKKELRTIQNAVTSVATQIAEQKAENQHIHTDLAKQMKIVQEKIDLLFHHLDHTEPLDLSAFMTEAKTKGYSPQQWLFIKEMLQFIGAYTVEDLSEEEMLKDIKRMEEKDLLHFHSSVDLHDWKELRTLPNMIVDGFLDVSGCINLHNIENVTVKGVMIVEGCSKTIIAQALALAAQGKVGGISDQQPEEKEGE